MSNGIICQYCGQPSKIVTGDVFYERRDLALLKYHWCEACDARVGCHRPGTYVRINGIKKHSDGTLPMGQLANKQLRRFRQRAHELFDVMWKKEGYSRRIAYLWLSRVVSLPLDQAHIGDFNIEQCKLVIEACKARGNK